MGQAAIPLIGMAISAAGTGVSMAANASAQKRMNNQLTAALKKQDAYSRTAGEAWKKSLGESSSETAKKNIDQGEQAAGELYKRVQAAPQGEGMPGQQDQFVDDRTKKQIGLANMAQAGLQGYPNMQLLQWLNNAETGRQLGVVTDLSNNAASIVPYQLQGAQASTADMAALGSLLGTGGSLLGTWGALNGVGAQPKPGTGVIKN
jgi:type II secretory pathway pseudopilin PulG